VRSVLQDLLDRIDLDDEARRKLAREVAQSAKAESADRALMALVAIDLDRYYTSLEATFQAVARSVDADCPSGQDWHMVLLERMGRPAAARPAVLSKGSCEGLAKLLRFRHFLRHAYAVDLDWRKLRSLADVLGTVDPLVRQDMDMFSHFLDDCLKQIG